MKRLSFLFRAVFVLLAVTFAGSCNTGGGGSGGGGSTSSSKSNISIKIGGDISSNLHSDITDVDTQGFYYEVHFNNSSYTSKVQGGKTGNPIYFDSVPYGSYTFYLDIFYNEDKKIQLGETLLKPGTVGSAQTTIEFDLKKSSYANYFFVKTPENFLNILSGKDFNGNLIDTSSMVAADESTWPKVYLVNDLELPEFPGELQDYTLSSETAVHICVDLCGHTISSTNPIMVSKNINVILKNGFFSGTGFGVLGFNMETFLPYSDEEIPLLELDAMKMNGQISAINGRIALTNGTEIEFSPEENQPVVATSANSVLVMSGDSKISCSENGTCVNHGGGKIIMLGATVQSLIMDQMGNADYPVSLTMAEGTFSVAGRTYEGSGQNRIETIEYCDGYTGSKNFLCMGGDSVIDTLTIANDVTAAVPLYVAVVGECKTSDGHFVNSVSGLSTSTNGQVQICKTTFDFEGAKIPFSATEPDDNSLSTLFVLPTVPDPDFNWQWNDAYMGTEFEYYQSYYFNGDA